jgi:hypothetical protein
MENEIGLRKSDLNCISQGECNETFADTEIKRVLGTGYKAYENLVQEKCIQNARENGDLEGYEKCPHVCHFTNIKCDFGIIYENCNDPLFVCLTPECGKVTCRRCQLPGHEGLTCKGLLFIRLSLKRHERTWSLRF